jgi:hypothetical protein
VLIHTDFGKQFCGQFCSQRLPEYEVRLNWCRLTSTSHQLLSRTKRDHQNLVQTNRRQSDHQPAAAAAQIRLCFTIEYEYSQDDRDENREGASLVLNRHLSCAARETCSLAVDGGVSVV